jgi:hypothetical protein
VQALVLVRAQERVPERAQALGLGPVQELAPATAWAMEQSGRVRRFHNLPS